MHVSCVLMWFSACVKNEFVARTRLKKKKNQSRWGHQNKINSLLKTKVQFENTALQKQKQKILNPFSIQWIERVALRLFWRGKNKTKNRKEDCSTIIRTLKEDLFKWRFYLIVALSDWRWLIGGEMMKSEWRPLRYCWNNSALHRMASALKAWEDCWMETEPSANRLPVEQHIKMP